MEEQELTTPMGEPSKSTSTSPRSVLKHINSLNSPGDLLRCVESQLSSLDTINLATVLYRLARLYSFVHAPEQKTQWRAKLFENPIFTLLLNGIYANLVEAQEQLTKGEDIQGLNAWCISNLLWSLVKLEVTRDTGHVRTLALATAVSSAPLAVHFLGDCSGQGLGNLLWSYVQLPGSPPFVKVAILTHIIRILEGGQMHVLDAHALAQTLWCAAHARATNLAVDQHPEWQEAVTRFLLLAAQHSMQMLIVANPTLTMNVPYEDDHLLYQAMATITWSYSVILGSVCGAQAPLLTLFLKIRERVIIRLRLIVNIGLSGRPLPHVLSASFNGQTLSYLVAAYQTAQLLTPELLQAILSAAAVRLSRPVTGPHGLRGFKPADLVSLLRAGCLGLAQPLALFQAVTRLMGQHRNVINSWSAQEIADVNQALQDVRPFCAVTPPSAPTLSHLTSNVLASQPVPVQLQQQQHHHQQQQQLLRSVSVDGMWPTPAYVLPGAVARTDATGPSSVNSTVFVHRAPAQVRPASDPTLHPITTVSTHANYLPHVYFTESGPRRVGSTPPAAGVVDRVDGLWHSMSSNAQGRVGANTNAMATFEGFSSVTPRGRYVIGPAPAPMTAGQFSALPDNARQGAMQPTMPQLWGGGGVQSTPVSCGPLSSATGSRLPSELVLDSTAETFLADSRSSSQMLAGQSVMWVVDEQGTAQPATFVVPSDVMAAGVSQPRYFMPDQ